MKLKLIVILSSLALMTAYPQNSSTEREGIEPSEILYFTVVMSF